MRGNPLGSAAAKDLYDNAQNFDFALNDITQAIWNDRFGRARNTWFGLETMVINAAAAYGYIILNDMSFQDGGTVNLNELLLDESTGEYFKWTGTFRVGGKVVPPGSTPASTGGEGPGAWLSVGNSTLRTILASSLGAGMVGYDSGETYAPGSVGDEIGPYEATGADNKYGRKDRARRHLSAVDFGDPSTDIGAAVNLAIASLATEYNPSAAENIRGGEVELPRGTRALLTPINLEKHASGITGLRIIGQGQSTSELDMIGAVALSDGVAANTNGASFFRLQDFNVKNAPRRSVSLNKYSRGFISGVQSESANGDGFYFGNGIVMCIDNIMSHASVSNGVRFNPGTVSDPSPGFQHTSHSVRAGYVSNSQGDGWLWGYMNYSNGVACAADNCARYGHLLERCNGFSLDAPGAETNGRSGIGAISSATVGENKATIRDAFMYANNTTIGGYPNCLHVLAQDGVKNEITLLDSVSIPAVGDTTPCILVDGVGAELTMNRQKLPNGWKTQNGGYIKWIHDTLLVKNITIVASIATPICNTMSTQGHKTRYGGIVTVMASNQPPSTPERNTTLYHLLVNKSIGAGSQIIEIAKSGHVSGGGVSLPSFTWTLVNDQLVATPSVGVGGVPFWFEVTTDSQIVVMPL